MTNVARIDIVRQSSRLRKEPLMDCLSLPRRAFGAGARRCAVAAPIASAVRAAALLLLGGIASAQAPVSGPAAAGHRWVDRHLFALEWPTRERACCAFRIQRYGLHRRYQPHRSVQLGRTAMRFKPIVPSLGVALLVAGCCLHRIDRDAFRQARRTRGFRAHSRNRNRGSWRTWSR